MTYQIPNYDKSRDPGAYAHIIINETVASLPGRELQEYGQLQNIKRKKRTARQQARIEELWQMASDFYVAPGGRGWRRLHPEPPDPWYDELARRMWNRLTEEEKADWTARNPAATRRYLSPAG